MRNKILILLAAFMLASCTEIITVTPPPANVRIYNSAWDVVRSDTLQRSITSTADLEAYVEEYNASNTDDQLFLIEGEEVVPIEEAPNADAYIVDYTTHDIIAEYLDWPRIDLSDRRELWRFQAMASGGVLYVDRVPPPPIPVIDDRPAYEKYALYLIYTDTGIIKYEEHPETEAEFIERRAVYELQVMADGGLTYMVAGRLYPDPETEL